MTDCDRSYSDHPGAVASRKFRSDPEKAERQREWSREWKRQNRERNRARDRARYKAKGRVDS